MNKRNKLQINNAETSMASLHTDSIVLNPRLTAGYEQPKTSGLFHSDPDYPPPIVEEQPPKKHRMLRRAPLARVVSLVRANALYIALVSIILYLSTRPSEYTLLIDEIYNLKEQNLMLQNRLSLKNRARVACGTRVSVLSPLYSYGFLRGSVSDPDCILEPTGECLGLGGQQGAFELRLVRRLRITRIGVYHPATGNYKSAMYHFAVAIGEDQYTFAYKGSGYEEFEVDSVGDTVRWDIADNYGERAYTCVYQVYVYG